MNYKNETEFTRALLKELRKIPRTKWWRNNTGRRGGVQFGEVGSPDIMGIVGTRGLFVGIETKTDTGGTTDDQQAWLHAAIERGALCIVARPSCFADVIRRVATAALE